jgi:hypothetical protein
VTISASGTDPGVGATGIKEFELYYSIGGGYVKFATVPAASPSAALNLPAANKTYWFRSNAVDNQGNREGKTVGDTNTYVGDVFPPASQATTLNWSSGGQFEMQISGSKSSGQPILYFDVHMTVDGGAAQKVDSVGAVQTSAGQFSATSRVVGLVDGQQHTYGFDSVAVDGSGNVEAAPGSPDRTATGDIHCRQGSLHWGSARKMALRSGHGFGILMFCSAATPPRCYLQVVCVWSVLR